MDDSRIILAADGLLIDDCLNLVLRIGDRLYAIKIHDLYDQEGPGIVARLKAEGAQRVWVDAKLHDIPNTVVLRARAYKHSDADILTVHASGGIEMMTAAVANGPKEIYAITVLTSLTEEEAHLLHGQPSKSAALSLARNAKLAGVHGIVCSPKEVGILSKRTELRGLKFITPGVRSFGSNAADQQRVDTPAAAIRAGATHIVIGRQITKASDPYGAMETLEEEIAGALAAS